MNELFVLRKGEKTASKDSIIKIKVSTLYEQRVKHCDLKENGC